MSSSGVGNRLNVICHARDMLKIGHRPGAEFGLIVMIIGAVLFTACTGVGVAQEEIARIASPDSVVDAVLVESNCGATCGYAYLVTIVPRGEPAGEHPLFRADKASGLNLEWERAKVLNIEYDSARIFHFSNFWQSRDVDNFRYTVRVRLRSSNEQSEGG